MHNSKYCCNIRMAFVLDGDWTTWRVDGMKVKMVKYAAKG